MSSWNRRSASGPVSAVTAPDWVVVTVPAAFASASARFGSRTPCVSAAIHAARKFVRRGRGDIDGVALAEALWDEITDLKRVECDASELRFGVECGCSDATSGIVANPWGGAACDRLVKDGGTATFSETPEFIGAEHILADRCIDESIRERLLDRVDLREGAAELMGVDLRGAQPSPGNQEGGLTTIEEKSLGAISKGGTATINGIVDYAEELPVGGATAAEQHGLTKFSNKSRRPVAVGWVAVLPKRLKYYL